jgi:hypothetical protein
VATGHVESSFNPGHCHADPVNAALVTHLLDRYTLSTSTTGAPQPLAAAATAKAALDEANTTAKVAAATKPSKPLKHAWTALLLVGQHYYADNRRDPSAAGAAEAFLEASDSPAPRFATTAVAASAAWLGGGTAPAAAAPAAAGTSSSAVSALSVELSVVGAAAAVADRWPLMAAWQGLFSGRVVTREAFYGGGGGGGGGGGRGTTSEGTTSEGTTSGGGGGSTNSGGRQGGADVGSEEEPSSSSSSARGGSASRSFRSGALRLAPGEEIALAALSPNPMMSFWWAPRVSKKK